MNRTEKIVVLLALLTVLSLVLMFGAVLDLTRITFETTASVKSQGARIALLEDQLKTEAEQHDQRMRLLEGQVQFFISGGWK